VLTSEALIGPSVLTRHPQGAVLRAEAEGWSVLKSKAQKGRSVLQCLASYNAPTGVWQSGRMRWS
jgi:hypothetical protein